jgi:predicted RecA/RadA family phage recombinase
MAKKATRIQEGKVIEWVADGIYANGDVVPLNGERIGVAMNDAVVGDTISLAIAEVFTIEAKTSDVIAYGQAVFWDATAGTITTTSSGTVPAGIAVSTKAAGTAGNILVKLG